ncbi:copper-binding protein [Ramlibacter sp. 2FC]|uniref:copper-binding protein n=1 Tax=Ramlibacter sp. 2FC TaxID=2502188 RepID=UPI0010F9E456|nr:copper-binding protein [Ramlibacter sp. 2FC]
MNKVSIALLLAGLLGGWSGIAVAQAANEHASHHAPTDATASADLTDGEVRKVDKTAAKLTIKHGPIKNLDMPGMTMVFQVRDAALLDKVQAGDKLRFRAENQGGKFFVTEIQPAR